MEQALQTAILHMTERIADLLAANGPHIYLYGSVTMNDYRAGWSDIDLLVLTDSPISHEQAKQLLTLRQLLVNESGDEAYRRFEGGMLSLDAFMTGSPDIVVYWGTSGQRLTDRYAFDSFSMWELLHGGMLLHGTDVRTHFTCPDSAGLRADVALHLAAIRQYGHGASSLYCFGWLLDIARGLYTLHTGRIASKTAAGQWALDAGLCPEEAALSLALQVRRCPALMQDESVRTAALGLTTSIQRFADVLEAALRDDP